MNAMTIVSAARDLRTPDKLIACLAAIALTAASAAAVAFHVASMSDDAARTIAQYAEPSVALGLRMAAGLAQIESDALGDSLTDDGRAAGASATFRTGLATLRSEAIEAARNITYGENEAAPLRDLDRGLQLYLEAIVGARGTPEGNAWLLARRLKWASRVMREMTIPHAFGLARADDDELERVYGEYRSAAVLEIAGVAASYLLGIAALVGAQVWLTAKTRRLLNPLLVVATVLVAGGGVGIVAMELSQRADLGSAKTDAYDSLHALFEAEARVYALRGDVSLWLLDPDDREGARRAIERDLAALVGADIARDAVAGPALKAPPARAAIGGLLGEEMKNVTFPGEREAASASVAELARFARVAGAVQGDEIRCDHARAVDLWVTDARPGGGRESLAGVVKALDATINVNQTEFDDHANAALATGARAPWMIAPPLALAMALAVGGIWPRLREYR